MGLSGLLPWRHVPPVLRRQVRIYLLATILASGGAVALALLDEALGIPRERLGVWGRYGPLVMGLLPCVVFLPLLFWSRRRLRSQFNDARGRLCTHCTYSLAPMGERGRCPECGHAFDAQADATVWEAAGFRCEH